jgi:RHS repeat-associated protein
VNLDLYGVDGKKLEEVSVATANYGGTCGVESATVLHTNVWFGGRLLAPHDRLSSNGKYFPYGEDRTNPNPANPSNGVEKFATYTRDSSTGLDYAYQRYYTSGLGRFLTGDPLDASASSDSPQTWNRFAYVSGDPIGDNDPTGQSGNYSGIEDGYCPPSAPSCGQNPPGASGSTAPPGSSDYQAGLDEYLNDVRTGGYSDDSDAGTGWVAGDDPGFILGLAPTPTAAPPAAPDIGVVILDGVLGSILRIGSVAVGIIISPTSTGGWGDTVPTVEQIQQECTKVGNPVIVPSTNRNNKGGTSIEQTYLCPDGTYWTIQTVYKPNGDIFLPPHIRPGFPKYGPIPLNGGRP